MKLYTTYYCFKMRIAITLLRRAVCNIERQAAEKGVCVQMLRDKIQNFDVGMFEQNVIAYLVMEQPNLLEHIHFEGDYCFNCW